MIGKAPRFLSSIANFSFEATQVRSNTLAVLTASCKHICTLVTPFRAKCWPRTCSWTRSDPWLAYIKCDEKLRIRSCTKLTQFSALGQQPFIHICPLFDAIPRDASKLVQTCRACSGRHILRLRHVGSRCLERFEHHRRDVLPAVFVQPQSLYHGVLCNSFKPPLWTDELTTQSWRCLVPPWRKALLNIPGKVFDPTTWFL